MEQSHQVLDLRGVGVHYGDRTVLHDVSFSVGPGELIGVIGPNGAGKSTLFKAICGLVHHDGEVDVNGVHCHHRVDRMDVAYIPQHNAADLLFPITVGELAASGRRRYNRWYRRANHTDRAAARDALGLVGLGGYDDRALNELSGGQLQRAFIARALTQSASVMLLDESLSGVDQPTTNELFDLFTSLTATGTTLLIATHDLGLARTRFTRCLAVNRTLQGDGPPAQVLAPAILDATFGSGIKPSEAGPNALAH
jgi:ABC-type Mn2+/Zn2+ transport system ATPase subunit